MKSNKSFKSNQQIAKHFIEISIHKVCESIEKSKHQLKINKQPDYQAADASPQSIKYQIQRPFLQNSQQNLGQSRISKSNQSVSPSKYLNKFVSNQIQIQLNEKAKNFISKIRNRKKQVQGKFILKKMAQQQRKKEQFRKKLIQQQLQKQIQKQMRMLRAQKNIQFYKEKQKLYFRNNSNSPSYQRKISTSQSIQSRNYTLPSVYQSQLQQIKQQTRGRKRMSLLPLQKTVLKKKKRSYTQADIHNKTQQYSQKHSRQISLFDRNKSTRSKYSYRQQKSTKRMFKPNQDEDKYNKKCYLMSRHNTEDISIYLQKFSNMNQLRSSNLLILNDKINSHKKNERKREYAKSHLQLNQDYQQSQRNSRYKRYQQQDQF